jgi:hypothetical protein
MRRPALAGQYERVRCLELKSPFPVRIATPHPVEGDVARRPVFRSGGRAMGFGIRDLVFTGLQRAWEESFVERYRLWDVRVVGIEVTQGLQLRLLAHDGSHSTTSDRCR